MVGNLLSHSYKDRHPDMPALHTLTSTVNMIVQHTAPHKLREEKLLGVHRRTLGQRRQSGSAA